MTTQVDGVTAVKKHYGARTLIQHFLPTFCWQTLQETLTMLEQYDIEAPMDYRALKVTISDGVRRGVILKRRILHPAAPRYVQVPSRYEYMRNPEWKSGSRCHKIK